MTMPVARIVITRTPHESNCSVKPGGSIIKLMRIEIAKYIAPMVSISFLCRLAKPHPIPVFTANTAVDVSIPKMIRLFRSIVSLVIDFDRCHHHFRDISHGGNRILHIFKGSVLTEPIRKSPAHRQKSDIHHYIDSTNPKSSNTQHNHLVTSHFQQQLRP